MSKFWSCGTIIGSATIIALMAPATGLLAAPQAVNHRAGVKDVYDKRGYADGCATVPKPTVIDDEKHRELERFVDNPSPDPFALFRPRAPEAYNRPPRSLEEFFKRLFR